MALEARYTGGPRPPVDRRSNARDDLDDFNPSPISNLAERLVTVALSGNFVNDTAQLHVSDTTPSPAAL